MKINKGCYINQILEPVKNVCEKLYAGETHIFQQDSAPAHKAAATQVWCRNEFAAFIAANNWPPSSPDPYPLDYCVWSLLEAEVNTTFYRGTDLLKRALVRAWEKLSMDGSHPCRDRRAAAPFKALLSRQGCSLRVINV